MFGDIAIKKYTQQLAASMAFIDIYNIDSHTHWSLNLWNLYIPQRSFPHKVDFSLEHEMRGYHSASTRWWSALQHYVSVVLCVSQPHKYFTYCLWLSYKCLPRRAQLFMWSCRQLQQHCHLLFQVMCFVTWGRRASWHIWLPWSCDLPPCISYDAAALG